MVKHSQDIRIILCLGPGTNAVPSTDSYPTVPEQKYAVGT